MSESRRMFASGAARQAVAVEPLEPRALLSLTPAGPEFTVTQHPLHVRPAVAADADGDFVIAWEDNARYERTSPDVGVRAARFDALGRQLGRHFLVNEPRSPGATPAAPAVPEASFPAVAMAPGGGFVVAWVQGALEVGSIHVRRYDAAGAPLGAPFAVSDVAGGAQQLPAVAVDDAGRFVVAWVVRGRNDAGGGSAGVHARAFDASGAPAGPDLLVDGRSVQASSTDVRVATAMDAAGNFVVTWNTVFDHTDPYADPDVFARRYAAGGAPIGEAFRVNSATAGHQWIPDVAVGAGGDFVIAWQGDETGFDTVYARRFSAAGAPLGEFAIDAGAPGKQILPRVAADAAGNWVITWTGYDEEGIPSVYARRYAAAGGPDGAAFRLNADNEEDHYVSSVAVDRGGDDVVIAWMSTENTENSGVRARRFTTRGAPDPDPGPPPGIELAPTTRGIRNVTIHGPRPKDLNLHLPDYFADPDGRPDELEFTVVGNTTSGMAFPLPILSGADGLTIRFAPGVYGSTRITVRAVDADGFAARASFDVTVLEVPKVPVGGGGTNGAVRGRIFSDADGDGRRDNGEDAPVGVALFLDADADGVADEDEPTAITLPGGGYDFPTVPAGEYHLRATVPPGWRVSGLDPGPLVRAVTVRAGRMAKVKPIGLTQKVLVTGAVFLDPDGDGARDPGEAGLRGWRVFLDHNGDGARQSSEPAAKTDRSGRWAFGRLDHGAYRVTLLPRPGYSITSPGGGTREVSVEGGITADDNLFGVAEGP